MSLKTFLKKRGHKTHLKAFAWSSFDEIIEGEKSGADIWGTDYPIPTSDVLKYKLLKRHDGESDTQFVITSITSKILFFIPFTYDEYIIEIPWTKYTNEGFTAAMALDEIHAAENWNINKEMKYTGFSGEVTFEGCGKSFTYKCGNDYSWMIRTGI